ncbi:hypothetical protein Acr_06g0008570 [Actinidia rufa]|uniref:RRM domain-containing protein n=1 Tax=Actinidia rufa TaxID=165716 RepID=A0A7J0ETK6_9ERIC|nr:hypothetical protein Acr_06g0008570 [Actinidia rufa]
MAIQLFSRFGKILSIYISKKKSKISRNLFGFVRLGSSHDALRAVKEVNGLWIWGKTLMTNIARFEVQNKRELGNGGRLKNRAQVWRKREDQMDPKKQRTSYDGGRLTTVKVKELGNGWLYRSAIAKISSTRSIVRIQDQLRNLGHAHVLVRHMGGDMVVITFKDLEEKESMFNGGKMTWLKEWFMESSKWESTKSNPCSRLVWLNCHGIPLHLWHYQTFSEIGKIWGDVIMLAEDTIKNLSFAVGKVLISTTVIESINKTMELDNNGSLSQIRVMEEQLVSLSNTENGGGDRLKLPLMEEVEESINYALEAVPSLLGPCPTKADKTSCLVNINNMQLVPFTGSNGYEQTTRSSRMVNYYPANGRGTAISYLDALRSNLDVSKECIAPPKDPKHSLSTTSHNKKATPNALNDSIQVSNLPSIPEKNIKLKDKPKRKQRSIEDILGLSKHIKIKNGGRKGTDYMGKDEEVISRIMVTDEEAELRAAHLPQSK